MEQPTAPQLQDGGTAAQGRAPWVLTLLGIAVGAFLILYNLGDRVLWEDEAETAVVALNTLKYGYPRNYDGRNLVTQDNGTHYFMGIAIFGNDYNRAYAECYHPWLQHYLAAASLAFGNRESITAWTVAARLPFALLGVLTLALTAWIARHLFPDPWISAIAVWVLALHSPFLLHMRQCRYYALLAFLVPLVIFAYERVRRGDRGWLAVFTVAATLLFHSHYLVFGSVAVAIAAHFFLFGRDRVLFGKLALGAGVTFLLTAPWFLYARPWEHVGTGSDFPMLMLRSYEYLVLTNHAVFPFVLAPVLIWACFHLGDGHRELRRTIGLLVFVAVVVAALQPINLAASRNLMGLVPLGAIFIAVCVRGVWRRQRILAGVLLILILLTNLVNEVLSYAQDIRRGDRLVSPVHRIDDFPGWSRPFVFHSTLAAYGFELFQGFDGPTEAIVRHLKREAHPDDIVLTNYDWDVIIFYTDLRVANRINDPEHPDFELTRHDWDAIRWVSPRILWPKIEHVFPPDWEERLARDFEVVVRGVGDLPWNSTPQYHYHAYITPSGDDILLYRRKN